MPRNSKPKIRHDFEVEESWLRDFALFYGMGGLTRFCEDDLNGVSLTKVMEALAKPSTIRCTKCDGPGTECTIDARVGDDEKISVLVHFIANELKVEIKKAEQFEESDRDSTDAA